MRWSLSVYLSSTSYCLMICWYLLSLGVVWMCYLLSSSLLFIFFFFSSRRRHTRLQGDWSSDVCSSDLGVRPGCGGGSRRAPGAAPGPRARARVRHGRDDDRRLPDRRRRCRDFRAEIGRASCRERV